MKIDRSGIPFIVGALAPVLLVWLAGRPRWSVPLVAAAAFFAFFFRDPERLPPLDSRLVVSPADGRVLIAGDAEPGVAPAGRWRQISIFLSPLDVHVNRVPVAGRVARVDRRPGRFLPAYRHDAAVENERCEVWIEHGEQVVVMRQVVGILARRIVCRLKRGAEVKTGDRFGIMKFGSRMDVFLPLTATLHVRVGESVRGGETVLAAFDQ